MTLLSPEASVTLGWHTRMVNSSGRVRLSSMLSVLVCRFVTRKANVVNPRGGRVLTGDKHSTMIVAAWAETHNSSKMTETVRNSANLLCAVLLGQDMAPYWTYALSLALHADHRSVFHSSYSCRIVNKIYYVRM